MLRIPHWLDNRFTDGDKVNLTFLLPEISSGPHFCLAAEQAAGPSADGRIGQIQTIQRPHWVSNPRLTVPIKRLRQGRLGVSQQGGAVHIL
jgi:hypothetical protein